MQLVRGVLKATGMIAQTANAGARLSRPVQSVVQHRLLAAPAGRLYATALQHQAGCARLHPAGGVFLQHLQFSRQQQHRQVCVKAAGTDEEQVVYELDMSLPANEHELSPEYRNYFALVGNISKIDKEPQGDRPHLLISLKVARQPYTAPGDRQQFDMFHVECWDQRAAEAAADPRLQEDSFVRIFGTLEQGQGSITMHARDFALITNYSPEVLVSHAPYDPAAAADFSQPPPPAAAAPAQQQHGAPSVLQVPGMPAEPSTPHEQQWMALFKNFNLWWDNRDNKRNPRAPDFTLKDKSTAPVGCPDALWIEDNKTPAWVKANLQLLPGGKPYIPPPGGAQAMKVPAAAAGPRPWFLPEEGAPISEKEATWVNVFMQYNDWWDNRLNKFSERSPDFKHKKKGAALWLADKQTPAWVHEHIETHLPAPPPKRQ